MPERTDAEIAALAQQDQQEAAARKLAQLLHDHFDWLLKAGFTESQAIWLVAQLQNVMLLNGGRQGE